MTDGVFCSQALRADAALQLADISAMRHKTDGELREYRRRFATSRDASQQCDDARVARRVERARRQPRSDEDENTWLLHGRFISRVVVETYLKRTQLVAAETGHARDITHGAHGLGVLGNDTVFDSLRRAAVETPYFTTGEYIFTFVWAIRLMSYFFHSARRFGFERRRVSGCVTRSRHRVRAVPRAKG